jgi:hypothetical protein
MAKQCHSQSRRATVLAAQKIPSVLPFANQTCGRIAARKRRWTNLGLRLNVSNMKLELRRWAASLGGIERMEYSDTVNSALFAIWAVGSLLLAWFVRRRLFVYFGSVAL